MEEVATATQRFKNMLASAMERICVLEEELEKQVLENISLKEELKNQLEKELETQVKN